MESAWLQSVFQETGYSDDSPHPKRIKFAEVHDELQLYFPDQKYSNHEVSRLIQKSFPSTESKSCTKSRQKHILGLERIHIAGSVESRPSGPSRTSESPSHSDKLPTSTSYSDLIIENQRLKARIQELERTSAIYFPV